MKRSFLWLVVALAAAIAGAQQVTPPPTITTTSLPSGTVGIVYSFTMSVSGGTSPYTWQAAGLPPGLSIGQSTGHITGVPTTPGTSNVTVLVTDAQQRTNQQTYSLIINASLVIATSSPLPNGTVGVAYAQNFAASGGSPPYRWTLAQGVLPRGVTLSGSGALSGTPAETGDFTFTVRVTDVEGSTATKVFSLTISPPPLTITTTSPLPEGSVGVPYSVTLQGSGGTPPYTWILASGGFPAGLLLNPSTGVITGTPSVEGIYTFGIRVVDSANITNSRTFSLTIRPPTLSITTASPLPNGAVGTFYSQALAAVGGIRPYTWSIAAGSLPAGLTLNGSTGVLSGTPTTAGAFSFTVRVTDNSDGALTVTKAFNLTITAPPINITTSSCPNGVAQTPYSCPVAAVGGTVPYAWSISAGSLPPGLTLNASTGVIGGSPTAAGTFSFTVRATDAAGASGTRALTITVGSAVSVTTASCPDGTAGTAYACALIAAGGTPPYSWAIGAGALPAGLSLDAASGVISGAPTAIGTFTFTAVATDAARTTASRAYSIQIAAPSLSPVTIRVQADVVRPAEQPLIGVGLAERAPVRLTGTLRLTFTPNAVVPADDPNVQFFDPATRSPIGRTINFEVEADSTEALFPGNAPRVPFQSGTVAGTITFTVTEVRAGAADLTPLPAPTLSVLIARQAPVITSVTIANRTATGFQVVVVGYSTSRANLQGRYLFRPSGSGNFQETTITVDVATAFTGWYQNAASIPFGSQFRLTILFNVQGDVNAIRSVSVTLTNAEGSSNTVDVNLQ